ncbi:MAG: flagellar biosynthesis protein FlhF [Arcobacter sp.]|nr:MAG: flagellar biosynthesis protein FlhF [Arcobacter sp.]
MIRKVFKKKKPNPKLDAIMKKYKVPRELLTVNRKMVSRAILVGLFIAMIPMPMQMLAVILIAPFFRFNVPIGVSLVWITNPFTMPVIYYVEYLTGNFLLMGKGVCDFEMSMQWITQNLVNIALPLYVGAAFYSLVLSVGGYYLINWLWIISVESAKKKKNQKKN